MTSEEIIEEAGEELAKKNSGSGEPPSEPSSSSSDAGSSDNDSSGSDGSGSDSSGGSSGLSMGNILLLAALVIQAGLAAYMLWPSSSIGEAGIPLLGEIESSAVTAMTIVEGDEEIGFEKAGSDWAIAGTGGFTTNDDSDGANKVVAVLDKLLAIDGNRLVTKTPSSHKRLQVAEDDFVRKVTISTADGDQTLYIGSSAGSGATHVRLDGSDEAFLTNQVSSFELNTGASSWIDTQYFSLESNDVTAFTLENGNGTFTFEREESATGDSDTGDSNTGGAPSAWVFADLAEGESLDQTKVNTMVNQATNLRMTKPIGTSATDDFGLDSEGANITFTVQESGEDANPDPQTVTLLIGGSPEDGTDYYARASDSEFVVLVSQYSGNQILDKTRADFLAEPEEDEAGADSGGTSTTADSPIVVGDDAGAESIIDSFELTNTLPITQFGGAFTISEQIPIPGVITATDEISATETLTETSE